MPTELPLHPNLQHLKKQAKALLRDFHQGRPDAIEKFTALRLNVPPKLSDAQHLVARDYGFDSWSKLKERVESLAEKVDAPLELATKAFREDDAATVRQLLKRYPQLRAMINEPMAAFDSQAITHVRSHAMLDVLLEAGADINAKSRWWAGGFGLLDCASPELAAYAIKRGAELTVHAAARLGMLEKLKQLVSANPELVHARGGDGQTPLHFASTVEIAEFLLEHGASIDARDVDHESTAAQYLVQSHPEVVRYLIRRGAKTDILMAAAIGDNDLVRKHLDAEPECIRMCVNEQFFPKQNPKSGGAIYIWTLGANRSPHQVASKFGHKETLNILMDRSPTDMRLLNACLLGDEPTVEALLGHHPELLQILSETDHR